MPGRPRLSEWPKSLATAAMANLGGNSEFEKVQHALHHAVEETPFGNRVQVGQHATELNMLLSNYRAKLNSEAMKPSFAKRYVTLLTESREVELIDYNAARQTNWAVRGIDAELAQLKVALSNPARNRIAELGMRAAVVQVESEIPGSQSREIFPAFVDAELGRQSQYDSHHFYLQLQSVRDALQTQ